MPVLVPDPIPPVLQELLEQRRRWGADRFDEVWEGVLHMNPAPGGPHEILLHQLIVLLGPIARPAGLLPLPGFNVGKESDYRTPDAGLLDPGQDLTAVYLPTAALAVEILSPSDKTWDKLPFYANRQVDELLIVDPQTHEVHWLALSNGGYKPTERSNLIGLGPEQLAAQIDWPPVASQRARPASVSPCRA